MSERPLGGTSTDSVAAAAEEEAAEFKGILKATSIVGGSAAAGVLIGFARVKLSAVLLGPVGVGLAGQFQQATGLVAQVTGCGVSASGVREMALAASSDDPMVLSRRYSALSRLTILTGVLGAILVIAFAGPLAAWSLGDAERSEDLAWLGPVVFLGHLAAGYSALIQGQRRLKRLAALNVLSALGGVIVAAPLYLLLGLDGVVPALLAGAAIQFLLALRLSRPGCPPLARLSPRAFATEVSGLVKLGLSFVAAGAMGTVAMFVIRSKMTTELGLEAVGLYSAAWALSGLFIKYVLDAMGADYVPHLTALSKDDVATNRAITRQIEVGVLLSTGGLMATQTFAPLAITLFYDGRFNGAIELLQLFTLGMMAQIIFWPIGYVLQARAHIRAFGSLQAVNNSFYVAVFAALIERCSLNAVAYAFIATQLLSGVTTLVVVRSVTGFRLTRTALRAAITGTGLTSMSFALNRLNDPVTRYTCALILLAIALRWSAGALRTRLGYESWADALRRRQT